MTKILQFQQATQTTDRLRYLMTVFQPAAVETVAGLAVVGHAALQRTADEGAQFVVRLAPQDGPLLGGRAQAAEEHVDGHVEKHRLPLAVHVVHVVEEAGRAASGGDDDVLELARLVQHVALQLAEAVLAPLAEKLGDGAVETLLDVPVEVDEGQPQFPGEGLAKGSLSGTHVAGQKDAYHNNSL